MKPVLKFRASNAPRLVLGISVVLSLTVCLNAQQKKYTMLIFGVPPGDSQPFIPARLASDGSVLGYTGTGGRVYSWRNGTFTEHSGRGASLADPLYSDLNGRGDFGGFAGTQAVIIRAGTVTPIPLLPGFTSSGVAFINDMGEAAGYNVKCTPGAMPCDFAAVQDFIYAGSTSVGIPLPAPYERFLAGKVTLGASGLVAGTVAGDEHDSCLVNGVRRTCPMEAYLYSNGESTALGTMNGFFYFTQATAVNSFGEVVGTGGYFNRNAGRDSTGAFIYSTGVMTQLPELPDSFETLPRSINDSGQIVGTRSTSSGLIAFLYQNGNLQDLFSLIDNSAGWASTDALAINNKGQIIGSGFQQGVKRGFILNPSSCSSAGETQLLDPLPFGPYYQGLLSGTAITRDKDILASSPARSVQGAAADGVSQILVRLPACKAGDTIRVRIVHGSCNCEAPSNSEDGVLSDPLKGTSGADVQATAQDTSSGPMAFVVYRAPLNFARTGMPADNDAVSRSIVLRTDDAVNTGLTTVKVVRPPVVLIHGVWSDPRAWDFFLSLFPAAQRFSIYTLDYSFPAGASDGVIINSRKILLQIQESVNRYRSEKSIAAIQVDVVAHSMGGLITRQMTHLPDYNGRLSLGNGYVHKLISIDTPHLGSQLAANLDRSSPSCRAKWQENGKLIGDAVRDLRPDSEVISTLLRTATGFSSIPAHAIIGSASEAQANSIESSITMRVLNNYFCAGLLPTGRFVDVLLPGSDLIVGFESQAARGLGRNGTIPATGFLGYVHSVDPSIFYVGPDVLSTNINYSNTSGPFIRADDASEIPAHVADLLNANVNDSFAPILP